MLPTKTVAYHDSEVSTLCQRLTREWQTYIFLTHSLRKTFISIKGMYYRAEIQSQPVTWLVPHNFSPILPNDVDYRVMLTFLEFHTAMIRFVLFKLYFDLGYRYPPKIGIRTAQSYTALHCARVADTVRAFRLPFAVRCDDRRIEG